jgi:hypothetical protein
LHLTDPPSPFSGWSWERPLKGPVWKRANMAADFVGYGIHDFNIIEHASRRPRARSHRLEMVFKVQPFLLAG